MTPVTPSSVCDSEREAFFFHLLGNKPNSQADLTNVIDYNPSAWNAWQARAALAERTQQEALTPRQVDELKAASKVGSTDEWVSIRRELRDELVNLVHEAERSLDYRPEFRRSIAAVHAGLEARPTSAANSTAPMQPSGLTQSEIQDVGTYLAQWGCLANPLVVRLLRSVALAAPTQAAGGEALAHRWDADGERCTVCGDKDWMGGPCSGAAPAAAVEPTPCATCSGRGVVARSFRDGDEYDACPECNMPDPERAAAAPEGLTAATEYARNLAVALHRDCYPEVTQWKPLDDLLGLLTQIDNMVSGMARIKPATPDAKTAEERKPLSDAQCDRILSTCVPGGSQARDWFLPHEQPRGLANVRDVVRLMVEAAHVIGDQP